MAHVHHDGIETSAVGGLANDFGGLGVVEMEGAGGRGGAREGGEEGGELGEGG